MRPKILFFLVSFITDTSSCHRVYCQDTAIRFRDYIQKHIPDKKEIDVFLNDPNSWAKFDPELGYILGNYMPHDGINNSRTFSSSAPEGYRTRFVYKNKKCRINTYGNSFTQCHQVSDGETWQEYLSAHLGEPVRNYGMGGYGLYQAYLRMLREESTQYGAKNIVLYIWGDDHYRSMFRTRYMVIDKKWVNDQAKREGVGKMFHGNFWANIELDLATGKLKEYKNRIAFKSDLYKMTDPDWMYKNLEDDMAMQMILYAYNIISDIDSGKVNQIAKILDYPFNRDRAANSREYMKGLIDKYSFACTKYILEKARDFASRKNKNLLIVLFDPSRVTRALIENKPRYDAEIVEFLNENGFNYFDMNIVHQIDFQDFKVSVSDYYDRYFVAKAHYSPAGNHFFAYSILPKILSMLDPKPAPYSDKKNDTIDFDGYFK